MGFLRRSILFLLRWSGLLVVPGGLLWTLSPFGISISELAFSTPNVFWKLFPSSPLLLLAGLVGLQLRQARLSGILEKIGFWLAALGLVLVVVGAVGLFWLRVDDVYLMLAPAYRAFRFGLLLLGVGSILFGATAPRGGALPTWGLVPFVPASLAGLAAFAFDLGPSGALLWMLFGLGWGWLGLSLVVHGVLRWWADRPSRAGAAAGG